MSPLLLFKIKFCSLRNYTFLVNDIPENPVNAPRAYIRIKDKFNWPIFEGTYIWEEKRFNLQSVKLTFLSFLQYKARILAFFTSCKMGNMFKVNNKDTRIRKVNDKVKNKGTVDIVLASLLLTLNAFHFLLHCFLLLTLISELLAVVVVCCSDALCQLESI